MAPNVVEVTVDPGRSAGYRPRWDGTPCCSPDEPRGDDCRAPQGTNAPDVPGENVVFTVREHALRPKQEFGLELRTRDRERKLLRKIDSALSRIDDGSYGYCEETGEEIGLKRLEARPVATLCLEAQERRELAERQFRDRDDRYR